MMISRFAYWSRVRSLLLVKANLPFDAIAADLWDEESPSGAHRNGTSNIQIKEHGNYVLLDVRDASLDRVMRQLAASLGFRLEISGGPLDRRVTRSLQTVPATEAIEAWWEKFDGTQFVT